MPATAFSARLAGVALALMATLLAGCVGTQQPPADPVDRQATTTPTPDARVVSAVPAGELLFPGTLLICSDLPYPPQEFFDATGEPIGSDIEIGQEIARRLGLEAKIVNSIFDTIIDAVLGGKCDIVISAQSINAERQHLVDMIPYFRAGQTFVVKAGNPDELRNELDLCGARVATQRGTIQSELIRGNGEYEGRGLSTACLEAGKEPIALTEFEKDDQAVDALIADEVDAYFLDSPAAGYHVLQQPADLELMGLTLDVADQGISVPPDRQLLRDAIADALASMIEDGSYQSILDRYGVGDGSIAGG